MPLKNKNIVLGVSGGIAAYKTVELVSQLVKLGANVNVICTPNALNFVSTLSLEAMSKNKVYSQQYILDEAQGNSSIEHISLADSADLILLAPATANLIGKLASGVSDNLLTDTCLASRAPIIIAPAMNTNMWNHKKVQENIKYLKSELNYQFIEPEFGELACGHVGLGRLAELETITSKVSDFFDKKLTASLRGKKILITAGGTKEPLDPVRFIGNRSSGKMGFALVKKALEMGAEVTLLTTVPCPLQANSALKVIKLETAFEMKEAVLEEFPSKDVLLMAAAVADFSPIEKSKNKLKKTNLFIGDNSNEFQVTFKKNPDILAEVARIKTSSQITIGFCVETENIIENAQAKLENKKLDMIIANSTDAFESNSSEVSIITNVDSKFQINNLREMSKDEVSQAIYQELVSSCLRDKNPSLS